jgi:hypothetical protein
MPDKEAPRKGTRIKVDKLQKEEEELTKEEQKKVKGGNLVIETSQESRVNKIEALT